MRLVRLEETEESIETDPVEESDDTHRTSIYGMLIPHWSICLKPRVRVRGKGTLTRNPQTEEVNDPVIICAPHVFVNT